MGVDMITEPAKSGPSLKKGQVCPIHHLTGCCGRQESAYVLRSDYDALKKVAEEMRVAIYPLSQSLGELPMMQIDIERARKVIAAFDALRAKER